MAVSGGMNEVAQAGRLGDHWAMRWWAARELEAGSWVGHGPLRGWVTS